MGGPGAAGADRARLMFPRLERLLERPFARIPQRQVGTGGNGFGLGLVLGLVFVPCAGPVFAAIVVAAPPDHRAADDHTDRRVRDRRRATADGVRIGRTANHRAGQCFSATSARDSRRRRFRDGFACRRAGVRPARCAAACDPRLHRVTATPGRSEDIEQKLNLGGIVTDQNRQLANCSDGGQQLQNCGPAPSITGVDQWLNGPPLDMGSLRGKVVLIDFWAYSCINCQRSIPHIAAWYDSYRDDGLTVIGIHTPEYAFESSRQCWMRPESSVSPIHRVGQQVLDVDQLPQPVLARALPDRRGGTVRHIKFGEGDHDVSEKLIRELLTDANPSVKLPAATEAIDQTPGPGQTRRPTSRSARSSTTAAVEITTRAPRPSPTHRARPVTPSRERPVGAGLPGRDRDR